MNSKSALPVPDPILQLQRQLDQFRSIQPHRTRLPETLGRLRWSWRGNTVFIRLPDLWAGLYGTEEAACGSFGAERRRLRRHSSN